MCRHLTVKFVGCFVTLCCESGPADDSLPISHSECHGRARLPVRSQAAHHRFPDSQERSQADDDYGHQRPASRRRSPRHQVHDDDEQRIHRRDSWGVSQGLRRSSALFRFQSFSEKRSMWLFHTLFFTLTLWRPLLSFGYSYKAFCTR